MYFKVITLTCSLLFLQSCALTDERQKTKSIDENADIKVIGQSIIEMGSIPKSAINSIDETNQTQADESLHNESLFEPFVRTFSETHYQQFLLQQTLMKNRLSPAVSARYQFALTKVQNKKWLEAIKLLDEVLVKEPQLSGAYLNKALSHYRLKQLDLAVSSLEAAEKLNAINPYIYNLQGVLAREQGQFLASERYYRKALAIWPDYPEAHLNIAILFELYRGEFVKAKTHYQAYLLLKPADQQAKQWLAGLAIKLALRKEG